MQVVLGWIPSRKCVSRLLRVRDVTEFEFDNIRTGNVFNRFKI